MNWLLMLLAMAGGMAVGTQAGINGALGKKVGSIEGALISFIIGTMCLIIFTFFWGKGNFGSILSVPKWQLSGGVLGAFYVFIMVFMVPKLGTASTIMAIIAGQLISTAVIDHFGFITGKTIPFDWKRGVGIVLMITAIILFNKK